MPKYLSEYALHDWVRFRPLVHKLKQLRYRAIDAAHSRQTPRKGDLGEIHQQIRGKRVLITIAYDDADVIDWQSVLIRSFVPDALHLVADNSVDGDTASTIAATALKRDQPYIWLPEITWTRGVTSRSHGLAMNWVFRNVILPGRPESFGFLDHDLFPVKPDSPFAPLSSQPFYGHIRRAGARWFLWAGFCVFKFSEVEKLPLDFGQDWFADLDTGGGNWRVLYKHIDPSTLQWASYEEFFYKDDVSAKEGQMHLLGSWLHEVGVRHDPILKADKRRVLREMLNVPLMRADSQLHPGISPDRQATYHTSASAALPETANR